MKTLILAILAITLSLSVFAQTAPSVESLENQRLADKAYDAMDDITVLMAKAQRKKRTDCLMAIGNAPFCDCVVENFGAMLPFTTYIQVLSMPKDAYVYDELDSDAQSIVDATFRTREACVGKF